ncbi:PilZ domain-containing protein [uncultured Desulfosarcina sp.]|uniref:PilZ domain-containing protein n=1 Tax=uncultured Desulfosarcina sp. TaxID=218289 RepID=UPI0029C79D35|nr:PilZ domain-containing protein [uncultured Desulfosarcina sp.]
MVERRKYKRYPMPEGTFAILRNEMKRLRNHDRMSIGEIAMVLYKSDPEVMGQVTDMSLGGLAVRWNAGALPERGDVELDLIMAEQGIYLHNIPYKTVEPKAVAKNDQRSAGTQRNAFRFTRLDTELKNRLRGLLAHHVG